MGFERSGRVRGRRGAVRRLGLVAVAGGLVGACGPADAPDGEVPPVSAAADSPAPAAVPSAATEARAPEVVGAGTISLPDRHETFPSVDPADGALWFSTYTDGFDDQTIWRAPATGDGWGEPAVAPFSGTWGDRAPRFSPDGARLYFTSNRPPDEDAGAGDMDIWVVERGTGGGWSEPTRVPPPVSSEKPDIHNVVTASALWVASRRADGFGRSDLYRIPLGAGGFGAAEHLPAPLNDDRSQPDLWVAPDESWMVLVVTDHPDGLGGDDLYVSRRVDGTWTAPENLGAPINADDYEYGPSVSPDGQWLYYTSHRNDDAQVYRVPVAEVRPGG